MSVLAIFWLSSLILVYHIFLYGLILWSINRAKRKSYKNSISLDDSNLPTITVVCAAFNEEKHIEKKIISFLNLDYPAEKIKIVIISDNSTDATNEIVQRYTNRNVQLIVQNPRGGKQRAHNLVEPAIDSELVLSTDANSIFEADAIKNMVKIMNSDDNIGLVSGELRLVKTGTDESGEGLYWKFESFLKQQESDFHSIIGANGSIFLIRRKLFTQIDPTSVDDFERTLHVLSQGFKAKYVSNAVVYEDVTEFAMEEFSRKVRIITQEWFALFRNINLLNPFKHFRISLILISHKVIRWLLFGFTIIMLICSMLIPNPFYKLLLGAQLLFYFLGALELAYQKRGKRIPLAGIPAYFITMNIASLIAFLRFLQNRNVGVWNPVRKQG
jgi:poly-beta-1,6-N-acetyl-D-glucosamine synthase